MDRLVTNTVTRPTTVVPPMVIAAFSKPNIRASCRNTLNHIVYTTYCIEALAMILYVAMLCRLALFLQETHKRSNAGNKCRNGNYESKYLSPLTPKKMSENSFIAGHVKLLNKYDHSNVKVAIYDNWNNNRGFSKNVVTSKLGYYSLNGIPNGKFEMSFQADGYVKTTMSVSIQGQRVTCHIDSNKHWLVNGMEECNLSSIGLT